MKDRSIITVKEWIWERIHDEALRYNMLLERVYKDAGNGLGNVEDRTKLRVEEVLAETEKAYKLAVEVETLGGKFEVFKTWVPKSQIVAE